MPKQLPPANASPPLKKKPAISDSTSSASRKLGSAAPNASISRPATRSTRAGSPKIHAPHAGNPDATYDDFLNELADLLRAWRSTTTIVLGDFNAVIGS
uniref:Endonuclease/exonuclease/phosphatase domain-containing protein n=1 Tax=Plectus sambesii TaxID=2011161 RepID=A0A914V7V2_9BILA